MSYFVHGLEDYLLSPEDTRTLIKRYEPNLNQDLNLPFLVAVFNTRGHFKLERAE